MIQYKEIDESGFVVETHVLEEWEIPPKNYIKGWGGEASFFSPKWDFNQSQWIENMKDSFFLNKAKEEKDSELSELCSKTILNGFDYLVDGKTYHFSYDREAQTNFQETYILFQNNAISDIKWTASINENKIRLLFNKEAFTALYFVSAQHKLACLSHYRDILKPLLDAAQTVESVRTLNWQSSSLQDVTLQKGNSVTEEMDKLSKDNARTIMALLEVSQMVIN